MTLFLVVVAVLYVLALLGEWRSYARGGFTVLFGQKRRRA